MSERPGPRSCRLVRRHGALLAVLALAATLRFWGLGFGLPFTSARPDEGQVVRTAVGFTLSGSLNPHFFSYPTLFMYVVGGVYAAGCGAGVAAHGFPSMRACLEADWYLLILVARAISAIAGVAGVAAVFAVSRRLHPSSGVPAAALLAVAFLHVRDSHFAVTDVSMTSILLLALLLLLRADEHPSPGRFAVAGFVAGLAAATKYNAIMLVAAAAVSQLYAWFDSTNSRGATHSRLILFCAAAVVGFLVATPYALVSQDEFVRDVRIESLHLLGGHRGILQDVGWRHHALFTLPLGVGWPLLAAGIAGILWMVVVRPRTAGVVFAFPLVYYTVAGGGYTVFARYMIPVVPFLCVGAGALIGEIYARSRRHRTLSAAVAAGLLILCAAPTAAKSITFDRLLTRTDSRVLAMNVVMHRIRPGSSILMTGGGFHLWYDGKELPYHARSWDSEFRRVTGPERERPDWIVVEESPLSFYSKVPEELPAILQEYELRHTVQALTADDDRVYDQQDAFYLPLGGFSRIIRPGPNFHFYQRRDAP